MCVVVLINFRCLMFFVVGIDRVEKIHEFSLPQNLSTKFVKESQFVKAIVNHCTAFDTIVFESNTWMDWDC